ncbi:MAG TPA: metallophosphoesterase [Candidatus Angelobacter sp.]|nr:metallophosphoesterase [Candidatus Angelobacter sp.]
MRTRLVVFISIIQAILLLGHAFVYLTCAYFFGGWAALWEAKLAFALLSISFVAASLRGWYSFHPLIRTFYAAAAVWLGLFSFLFVASIGCWLAYGVGAIGGWGWTRPVIAETAFALAAAATIYGIVNAAMLRVERVTIKLDNLPPQWRGRTAVLVSDLHLGHIRNHGFVSRVVRRIAALQPDVVLIAGDLYDGTAGDFEQLALPWKELVSGKAASHGVYYIGGNHEEFYAHTEYLPALLRTGVRVLDNEKVEVDGLQIAGVHYRDAVNADRYRAVLRSLGLDRGRPSVLLLHAPVRLPISEEEGVSLQLSGHTHGGQFFPWTLVVQRVWGKFAHGLQLSGKMRVYTTYGAGTWGPPLRVGTRPEIVVISFE